MPWEKRLDNGLLLRTVRDERDMVRFAAFNEEINNRIEGLTCDRLLRNFPGSVNDNFHIIEDPQTGEVVSTTCIIPWRLYFCGVALDVAMPEMVVSRPSHRKLGLVRIQMERIAQAFVERKADLAILWGIPNYYRQYGYSYAVEGSVAEALHPSRIPKDHSARGRLKLVPAGEGDIPALEGLYKDLVRPLDVFIQRDAAHCTYMLRDTKMSVRLVVGAEGGSPRGYLIEALESSTGNTYILENAITEPEDALETLGILGGECKGELCVKWPQSSSLVRTAQDLGSTRMLSSQWMFLIPDLPGLLMRLKPVFDARIADSPYRNNSTELIVNLFREAFRLTIRDGRLSLVEGIGFRDSSMGADGGDLLVPRDALVRLLLGHNSLGELRDAWPDIVVKPGRKRLVEVLFPRLDAYLYTPYHFSGGTYYG